MGKMVDYKPSAEQIEELENSLTTAYNDKFDATEQTYTQIATVVPMDEKGLIFGWLTSDDDLEEFDSDIGRVVKTLDAHGARMEVKKYTKTIGISFDDIRDGKFTTAVLTAAGIGRSTKRHPDRLVYGVLKNNSACLYDGNALFGTHNVKADDDSATPVTFVNQISTGTGPYWYLLRPEGHAVMFGVRSGEGYSFGTLGADSERAFMKEQVLFGVRTRVVAAGGLPQFAFRSNKALNAANLEEAVAAMEAIPGPEGQPINNSPTLLVVSKANRAAGKTLIKGDRTSNGGYNVHYESMGLLVGDYL